MSASHALGAPKPRRKRVSIRALLHHPSLMHWVAPFLLALALLAAWVLQTPDPEVGSISRLGDLLYSTARNALPFALLALGAGMVIATAGVDLSSAGVATAAGVFYAFLRQAGTPAVIAILLAAAVGAAVGSGLAHSLNARRSPVLIVSWSVGVLLFLCSKVFAQSLPGSYEANVGAVQLPNGDMVRIKGGQVWGGYTAVLALVILVTLTGLPRLARAVGANPESATCAGIPIKLTRLATYTVAGLFSALAGVTVVMLEGSANTSSLNGYELRGIAIAVLAGTSLSGGRLSLMSVVSAAFLWSVVEHIAVAHVPAMGENERHASGFIFALLMLGVALALGKRLSGDTVTITVLPQHTEP